MVHMGRVRWSSAALDLLAPAAQSIPGSGGRFCLYLGTDPALQGMQASSQIEANH